MMNIGFIGLGKLGLPVSVAMALHASVDGVYAYDSDEAKVSRYASGEVDLYEPNIREQLRAARKLYFCNSLDEVLAVQPEIIFVAVPTPSNSVSRRFRLEYVKEVLRELAERVRYPTTVALISTVLPGDMRRELEPLCRVSPTTTYITLVYNPSFIAMGTTVADFLNPEFILLGTDYGKSYYMEEFYEGMDYATPPPILEMTWEEAEMTKMAYNTMIGFKIVYANALMEMAHKVGHARVDTVSGALSKATKRITSGSYLRGGMGDGGGCHPRDNMALGALAHEMKLSADPFSYVMDARMKQAEWIAGLLLEQELPVVLMGKRYKPNTNLTDYSAAQLVESILHIRSPETEVEYYDPLLGLCPAEARPSAFLICHTFDFVEGYDYPKGSVVIDPWRCFGADTVKTLSMRGVRYVPLGVS
jgi:UDPglucose 6-dehydrogenase